MGSGEWFLIGWTASCAASIVLNVVIDWWISRKREEDQRGS